ncbi:hypothetical protein EH220_05840 [bacterium]|nr:MAG: hypothetical protein EH220_05840 [bacterium]
MEKDRGRRLEAIFNAALRQPVEARPSFLGEACSEDTGMRKQVDILFSNDAQAGSLFQKPMLADDKTSAVHAGGPFLDPQSNVYPIQRSAGKSFQQGLQYFQQAVQKVPLHTLAYVGISLWRRGYEGESRRNTQRA